MDAYLGRTARVIDCRSGIVHDRAALYGAALYRAAELAALGVGPGRKVVLAHGESVAFLADLLAIWQVGAVAVIVSQTITAPERENIRDATGPSAWVGPNAPIGIASLAPASMQAAAVETAPFAAGLDDASVIMMTSGTTSKPKGVVLTHRALLARLALNRAYIGDADLAVSLTVLPMHFGHGLIGNSLTPLAAGATLVMWPEPGPVGLRDLGEVIDRSGITFMSSVPSLWRVATRMSHKPSGRTLRRVHVGSAPLSAPLWQDIMDWTGISRVFNMYGITETANWIGGHSGESGNLEDNKVGTPWGGSFRVKTEAGALALSGVGEVAVNSPSLMAGYFNMPEQTRSALAGHWFLTGDIGELGVDGSLRLIGRSKFEINKGGIKIPAEEVDALLERHPDILEACAFAIPDPASGEEVAAAVVLKDGVAEDRSAIKQWCEPRIRREAIPAKLYFLPALPRTDRGKLNRDLVRNACISLVTDNDRQKT